MTTDYRQAIKELAHNAANLGDDVRANILAHEAFANAKLAFGDQADQVIISIFSELSNGT